MNRTAKIAVVVALVVVVGVLLLMKRGGAAPDAEQTTTDPTAAAKAGLPRLLELGSTTCVPCKMMAPILAELKKEYAGSLHVEFIDVWDDPNPGKTYGIKLIPTQIFFDASGKERWRHEGFISKADILAKWKELGVNLSATPPPGPDRSGRD